MNFFEIVNKCLAELDCKQVALWDELTAVHHFVLKDTINRVNTQICLDYIWKFLEASDSQVIPPNTSQIVPEFDGRLDSIIIDNEIYSYTPNYMEFLLGHAPERLFTKFGNKILVKPAEHEREAVFLYYTNNCAIDKDGNQKDMLELSTDKSIIPAKFAEPLLVYGACMKAKKNPQLPKFNFWYKEYQQAYIDLSANSGDLAKKSPALKISRI